MPVMVGRKFCPYAERKTEERRKKSVYSRRKCEGETKGAQTELCLISKGTLEAQFMCKRSTG